MNQQYRRPVLLFIGIVILLLIPLIAMQFANEVNWTVMDFAVAAVLLLCTGFLCELMLRKVKRTAFRIILCVLLLLLLLIVWLQLAVGLF